MKPREVIVSLFLGLGVVGFILVLGMIDSFETNVLIWVGAVVATILWVFYILLVVRDNSRQTRSLNNPVLWMAITGDDNVRRWTAMDGSGRTLPLDTPPPRSQPIYDQEEN